MSTRLIAAQDLQAGDRIVVAEKAYVLTGVRITQHVVTLWFDVPLSEEITVASTVTVRRQQLMTVDAG